MDLKPPDSYGTLAGLIFLIIIALLFITYDAIVTYNFGQHNTLSRVLYTHAKEHPIIACLFGVVGGMLAGHLFWK